MPSNCAAVSFISSVYVSESSAFSGSVAGCFTRPGHASSERLNPITAVKYSRAAAPSTPSSAATSSAAAHVSAAAPILFLASSTPGGTSLCRRCQSSTAPPL